jgi:glutaryl-CoA dehydrogenase
MGLGATFQGLDYVNIEALLSEEERLIRDTVRGWVTAEVLPVIEHHFRDGTFPNHLIPAIGEMGLLGPTFTGMAARDWGRSPTA